MLSSFSFKIWHHKFTDQIKFYNSILHKDYWKTEQLPGGHIWSILIRHRFSKPTFFIDTTYFSWNTVKALRKKGFCTYCILDSSSIFASFFLIRFQNFLSFGVFFNSCSSRFWNVKMIFGHQGTLFSWDRNRVVFLLKKKKTYNKMK